MNPTCRVPLIGRVDVKSVGRAALLLLSACSQAPTLLIENTSGKPQLVEILSSSGDDVFLRDTIDQGAAFCWVVPEAARDSARWIMINDRDFPSLFDEALTFHVPFYSDSLDLRRSRRIRIHTPRLAFGTPAWKSLVEKLQADHRRYLRFGLSRGRQDLIHELENKEPAFRIPPDGDISTSQVDRYVTRVDITQWRPCKATE